MNWDGSNLSTVFGTDFPAGAYKISVRAQDKAGNWSQPVTTQLVVNYDSTAPTLSTPTWSLNPKLVSQSTNLTVPVTDEVGGSGVAGGEYFLGDSDPGRGNGATMNWDGSNLSTSFGTDFPPGEYRVSVRAQDNAGNWSQPVVTQLVVNADITSPILNTFSWSTNPKSVSQSSVLTVPATDEPGGSDLATGEYFLGDTDPGQGNGATMTLSNLRNDNQSADLTTTFGTDFPTGVYKVSVRAQDNAGNWSSVTSDYLVVYNPDGPRMTGKKTIVPSLVSGDILPGLISSSQTDKAKFAFNVKYNNQGQINPNSDLQFSYSTGTKCNKPAQAQNCHNLSLNATTIAWLTTQGTNNSTGVFQGTATMTVDGTATQVVFRVTGRDGERLNPTATDQFQIQIFPQGANPATDTPLYRVNAGDIARGNVKVIGDANLPPPPPPPAQ
jgi:hypothetical protein